MGKNKISANRVMSGTYGKVWYAGEALVEISAFQAKITYTKEDVQMCGQFMTDSKKVSGKGTGSFTLKKVYSRFASIGDDALSGKDDRSTIIGDLDDPDAYGAERVAFYNCSLDEEAIMDFAAGKTTDVTVPFTFTGREFLDKVVA